MKEHAFGALLSIVLAALQTPANAQAPASSAADETYTIQPGDVLEISVWQEEDLQREVVVRPDGGLTFPLAGELQARNKTVDELRAEIAERLARFIPELVVTVMVKEILGNRIYVIGQVREPGSFVVNPNVDVVQALSLAGGTTTFAKLDGIRVLRRERGRQTAMPFNYSDVLSGRDLNQNIMLRAGDVVLVP